MSYSISIIIPTLNRADSLRLALDAVSASIYHMGDMRVEVVVVNNGSTDNTQLIIHEWAANKPFPVKAIYEPKRGVSRARNAGIIAASNDLLVFTDDDCRMDVTYLSVLRRLYDESKTGMMLGGRVELGNPDDMPFTTKTDENTKEMTWTDFPGGMLLGGNMAIPFQIIRKVGAFDERFGPGAPFKSAEDTDYIFRVFLSGFRVVYNPELLARHYHGRKTKESIVALNKQYNIGNGAFFAKNWSNRKLMKHLYWDLRKMIAGKLQHPELGLSYVAAIIGNIKGALLYSTLTTRRAHKRGYLTHR